MWIPWFEINFNFPFKAINNLISSLFFLFNTKNLFEFICLVGLFIENEIISFFFLKNIFKHNEAKCRYKIFLEETNQELKLSSEDTLNFILYKKLELDKNLPILEMKNKLIISWLFSLIKINDTHKQIKVIAMIFIIPVILCDIDTKDETCHL